MWLTLCSLLIPIKLIAVTFAPGFLLADLLVLKPATFLRERRWEILWGSALWCLCLSGVLLHNHHSLHGMAPESYVPTTLAMLIGEVKRFGIDFFRNGLAIWYGSIRSWSVLIPFALTATLGLLCVVSLKRQRKASAYLIAGLCILGLSWAMELYRVYFAGPRLMGYGMLLALLGLVPRPKTKPLWFSYAFAVIGLTIYNGVSVSSLGLNHPVFAQAAKEAGSALPAGTAMVYTNTARLLDLHAGICSQQITDPALVPAGALYWHVDLPNFDAINEAVTPQPPPALPLVAKLLHGALYHKPS